MDENFRLRYRRLTRRNADTDTRLPDAVPAPRTDNEASGARNNAGEPVVRIAVVKVKHARLRSSFDCSQSSCVPFLCTATATWGVSFFGFGG